MAGPRTQIYQIYYDAASRASLHPALIPLDNRDGPPDWYEFWPMLRTLREIELEDDVWYGFLSPRVFEKAHLSHDDLIALLSRDPKAEVALFTSHWLQLAVARNVWEHGEWYHPGLRELSAGFFESVGRPIDFDRLMTDYGSATFSNYVVAKRRFWEEWRALAEAYLAYVEESPDGARHLEATRYRGATAVPHKVFVQERLACHVLAAQAFRVVHTYPVWTAPLPEPWPKQEERRIRRLLDRCSRAKSRHRRTRSRLARLDFRLARARLWMIRDGVGPVAYAWRFVTARVPPLRRLRPAPPDMGA
jgi:hypothetical protein